MGKSFVMLGDLATSQLRRGTGACLEYLLKNGELFL